MHRIFSLSDVAIFKDTSMKVRSIFLLVTLPVVLLAQQNPCPQYDNIIKDVRTELRKSKGRNYKKAILKMNAAREYCPDKAREVDSMMVQIFTEIEKERLRAEQSEKKAKKKEEEARANEKEAIAAKEREVEANEKAQQSLDEAKRILSYFPFYKDRVAWAYQKGKFGLIDASGRPITKFIYENAAAFNENDICIATLEGKKILIDMDGNQLSQKHNSISYVNKDYYKADEGGYLRKSGTLPFVYFDLIGEEKNELRKVKKGNKWNFLNKSNELLLTSDLEEVKDFYEGLARVKDEKGWYYIDTKMQRETEKYFRSAADFENGEAIVEYEGKIYRINAEMHLSEVKLAIRDNLSLGCVDENSYPAADSLSLEYFATINIGLAEQLRKKLMLRGEADGQWESLSRISGTTVSLLQEYLRSFGFMPAIRNRGFFDYYTQSSLRLFQENTRTVLKNSNIGIPDGITGPATLEQIQRSSFFGREDLPTPENPMSEFVFWIKFLADVKQFYLKNPTPQLQLMDNFSKPTDSRRAQDWNVSPKDVHLIGIRRNEDKPTQKRENDDIFILLINGMVFKFWGSTDPSPQLAMRKDIPFIIEGQHLYKVSWHKSADEDKVYRGLRPAASGVLVIRDKNADGALTADDINSGLDPNPNTTMNVHWSGSGGYNFSAGSQVIAGRSYINQYDQVIDCSRFAAVSYKDLGVGRTKAAYNVLMDLILTYSSDGVNSTVYYTLINDDALEIDPKLGIKYAETELQKMKGEQK